MISRTAEKMQIRRKHFHSAMLLGLATALSTGCASMKAPTEWFSKPQDSLASTEEAGLTDSIAGTGKGIAGQFKSMGTAVSSAVGKAKSAVTATFTSTDNNDDATSLANMPTDLGPEVWVANGHLFEAQGSHAKALDNYTKALEKEPNNEAALLSTARLYAKQEHNASSVEFFRKAIQVNPQNASTHNELAVLLQKASKNDEAQAAIAQAISLDPGNPRYRNNLAGMQVAVGRSDDAVSQLQQILSPAEANYNVAYLHFMNSNMASAQQHLEVALRTDPNLQRARTLLSRISESSTAQNAVAGFNTANELYRTAQAFGTQSEAGSAIFQQNAAAPGAAAAPSFAPNMQQPQMSQPAYAPPNGMQTGATQGATSRQPQAYPGQSATTNPPGPFLTGNSTGVPAQQVSTQRGLPAQTGHWQGSVVQNQYLPASQTSMPTTPTMPTMRSQAAQYPAAQPPATATTQYGATPNGPTSLLPPPANNRYTTPK